ncbi:MAG: signal peptidase I [Anaerolineae bacterium]|nr:signal peptidase I [Anaerolineae bacterium]
MIDPAFPSPSQPAAAPPAALPRPRLRGRSLLREASEVILLVVAVLTLVNLATARFIVEGESMLPSFDTGQFILVNRLNYLYRAPQRGEVVVFGSPEQNGEDLIKRIIGLPGETVTIQDQQVFIDGRLLDEPYIYAAPRYSGSWTLGPDEYFVLGDNRNNSRDSHIFGPLDREAIVGQAWLIYWPLPDWRVIQHESDLGQSLLPTTVTPPLAP